MGGMRYFLLMIAVVALVGCGGKKEVAKKPEPKKLITHPIVEEGIRRVLNKPTAELTKADLDKVTKLVLNNKQLTDVKGLEKLTQLTELYLCFNQLTDVKGLEKLTQLKELNLDDNPDLTKAQIAALKVALPKCKIYSTMKAELVTPKILHSPCDPDRADANELVQGNWGQYDTKVKGVSAELGAGASYVLVRGADTQRPSSIYAVTRNWSGNNLLTGKWLGSDSDIGNRSTMLGLTASQGQVVTMDGSARQATNADLGGEGTLTKAALTATGGVARGRTSLNLIRGPGL